MESLSDKNYIQQVSIECVIFGYQNRELKVLIPKLIYEGDFWALPGGFIRQDEDVEEAAQRILKERTCIQNVYMEQFQVMGKADRNSRNFVDRLIKLNANHPHLVQDSQSNQNNYDWYTRRFISIGYYALVDINKVIPQKADIYESTEWYSIKQIPTLILDYNEIVKKALRTLRLTLDQNLSAFNLLPETFTMQEIQDLYEAIYDKRFVQSNFPKRILRLNALERLEKKYTGAANKAPYLYRFDWERVNQLATEELGIDE